MFKIEGGYLVTNRGSTIGYFEDIDSRGRFLYDDHGVYCHSREELIQRAIDYSNKNKEQGVKYILFKNWVVRDCDLNTVAYYDKQENELSFIDGVLVRNVCTEDVLDIVEKKGS